MHLYDVVLFVHILTLLAAVGLATTLHHAEWSAREAATVGELRSLTGVYRRGKLFSILVLLLLLEGAWLLHLSTKQSETFHASDPWVWTAIVALVILGGTGGAVLDPHTARYAKLLAATPEGPITPELRAATFTTRIWAIGHLDTFLAIAVAFNMVTKPSSAAAAIAVLVTGCLIGVLIGVAGARGRAVA